jgi:flagellar hook-length control protein FliK
MFQFSLMPGGMLNTVQGAPSALSVQNSGLSGLLQQLEGTDPVFSAELHSLLMQMSPEMLRRLDEMLAGGMSLPQAASRLLGDQVLEEPSDAFAQLLRQDQGEMSEELSLQPEPSRRPGQPSEAVTQLLDKLPATLPTRAELTQAMTQALSAQPPVAGMMPPSTPGSLQLPPQLATNLLAMGVPQQVGSKAWEGAIADRVMWMVQGEQQSARLKLNPPNLGPLEVRVNVNQDQTSVSFLASQAAVRDALEAALPRLREMFDQQSLQLVRADVSDPGMQHGDRTQDSPSHGDTGKGQAGFGDSGEADEAVANAHQGPIQVSDQLVDLFV